MVHLQVFTIPRDMVMEQIKRLFSFKAVDGATALPLKMSPIVATIERKPILGPLSLQAKHGIKEIDSLEISNLI